MIHIGRVGIYWKSEIVSILDILKVKATNQEVSGRFNILAKHTIASVRFRMGVIISIHIYNLLFLNNPVNKSKNLLHIELHVSTNFYDDRSNGLQIY